MTVLEGFNINGILIGIAFVLYFAYIGRALNAVLKGNKLPSLITGFVSTMLVGSVLFLTVHINPSNNYKLFYVIYIIATIALATAAKPGVGFKFNKGLTLAIALAVAGTIVTAALIHPEFGGLNNDHGLYMKGLSEASEFTSSGIGEQKGIAYGFSAFYRFFGSFIGMLGTQLEFLGKDNYNDIRQYSPIYQTSTVIITAAITAELIKYFINDKKYVFMLPIFVVTFGFVESYRSTTLGSILLGIPVAYLYAMIYRKEYCQKSIVLVTVPFALFSSSVFMLFIGFGVMNTFFAKDRKPGSNLVFALVIMTKFTVAKIVLDDTLNHFILISSALVLLYIFHDQIKAIVSKIVVFISKRPYGTQGILFVLIMVGNVMDMSQNSTDVKLSVLRRGIVFKFIMIALLLEGKRGNKDLFIAICLMAILNLPYMELLNRLSENKLDSVMHRFGQLLLMGDRHSVTHGAYLIPVFMGFIIKGRIDKGVK